MRVAHLSAAVLLLALASASADASGGRPPVALTASPAHVDLTGAGRAVVHVTNKGTQRVVADVRRAGFALGLRGRPRIVAARGAHRSAARWLGVRPKTLAIGPGATRSVTILSRPPVRAEPGDHDALVLVTTRRRLRGRVAVRMRMGVVVVVRVPGPVRHRLELRGARVAGKARSRAVEIVVANRGNVTEPIVRRRFVLSLFREGRRIARLTAEPRSLRPRTVGVVRFRYPGRLSGGGALARVDATLESGRVLQRTYRVRL